MKEMKELHDLAVFGAPPAFVEPLHVGRPNIGNRERLMERINGMLDRRWLTNNGPLVQEFERKLADYLGVRHCIALCNGTVALEIAIRALDLKGEVIVPSFTFVATAHALQWQEITPVFADIDPATHNLDPASVERAITPRTTGIIGVHVWGRPCAIDALQEIADRRGLKLMFDAAHAFGCSHAGRKIGNFGECEVFSFHATKFFNTFEGGAIATNNDALAAVIRLMKNFGFKGLDNVVYIGTNGKMPEICAAMGLTGLEALETFVETNRRMYCQYCNAIKSIPGLRLINNDEIATPNHQYIIGEVTEPFPVGRDELVRILHAENILVRRYFHPGCDKMQPYAGLCRGTAPRLPHTVALCERVLAFPTGTSVSEEQVDYVGKIVQFVSANGGEIRQRLKKWDLERR